MPVCEPCKTGDHCGQPGERSPSCVCQHHPRKTRTDAAHGRLTAFPATGDAGHPGTPVPTPEAPPVAGTVPRSEVDDTPSFVSALTEWMREHRAGHFGRAAVLRRRMVTYLGRVGGNHDPVGGVDRD